MPRLQLSGPSFSSQLEVQSSLTVVFCQSREDAQLRDFETRPNWRQEDGVYRRGGDSWLNGTMQARSSGLVGEAVFD